DLGRAADRLVGTKQILRLKGGALMSPARLVALAADARRLVLEHHKAAPLDRGLVLETLRHRLADASGAEAAEEAIRLAAQKLPELKGDPIAIEGDVARSPTFAAAPVASDLAGALEGAERAVREAALKGVTEFAIKEATGAAPKDVKAI